MSRGATLKKEKLKKEKQNKNKGTWGVIGGIVLLGLGKMKWLLAILKFAKLSTLISMILSLGAYGLVYGWKFGFALIYLLLVHELGHYVACKMRRLPVKPTLFIPFIGAAVRMEKMPKSAAEMAFIAYMGPVFGVLSLVPPILLYLTTASSLWLVVLSFGALINLFNLIPFGGLDGGKIVGGISTKLWFLGLILIIVFVIYTHSVLATIIAILGVIHLWYFHKKSKTLDKDKQEVTAARTLYHRLQEVKEEPYLFREAIRDFNLEKDSLVQLEMEQLYEEFRGTAPNVNLRKPVVIEGEQLDEFAQARLQEELEDYALYQKASENFLQQLEKYLTQEEIDLQYAESYRTTSTKSRVITFIIYIALIIVLSVCLDVSKELLHMHPEAREFFNR
ncbi:site-2 protease family protein [Priestia filamentosa]|uniref:site-2 protease family protein n=1 Tax=Priestia filamentosa TaxID=1402861 RepID=UPI0005896822|nr:site-2 protease family protein [Priestia filamentosa]RJS63345.1 site-2 protease family protein [Priestia filamentosa]